MKFRTSRAQMRIAISLALVQFLLMACALPAFVTDSLNLNRVANIVATPATFVNAPTPTPPPANLSTAALVRQRGKVRVGIRYDAPPLASINGQGELVGFDVDLAKEMARRWLGKADAIEFYQVTSASAPKSVGNRELDMALGGIVHSKSGELLADFSQSYFEDGEAILIRKGAFNTVKELAGDRISWIDSPTTFALRDTQNANGITFTLKIADSYDAAYSALKNGSTDGIAGRLRRLKAKAIADPSTQVLAVMQREPVAIVLPQNDSDWADLVNITLNAIIGDGTYNTLYKKWMGVDGNPPRPPTDALKTDISALPVNIAPRDTLSKIKANQKIVVGYTQTDPLIYVSKQNVVGGFEIDLIKEFAKRWLGKAEAVSFVPLTQGQILDAVRQGQVDIAIGNVQPSQANEFNLDLSIPVFQSGVTFMVLQASRITTDVTRLNGQTVGLVGVGADALAPLKTARELSFNDVSFPDMTAALAALRSKQIIAIAGDRLAIFAADRLTNDTNVVRDQLNDIPYVIGLPANDSALRDQINLTLQAMRDDGSYATIYKRTFEESPRALPEFWPGEAVPVRDLRN
ncbi:MAG TPA: transporter substrate-binding domain-containing protein [Thermoflexales bacterium]|nr:transporter substrate-binding domain-containing protein [Thermoflexales bacterium]